jgi:hypothetical protein
LKTLEVVQEHEKPWIYLCAARDDDPPRQLCKFIHDNHIRVLNVAGPRASEEPEVGRFVTAILERLLNPALIYLVREGLMAQILKAQIEEEIRPQCIVRPFSDPKESLQNFASEELKADLLITGCYFGTMSGKELLLECKKLKPSLKVILFGFSVCPEMEQSFESEPMPPAYATEVQTVMNALNDMELSCMFHSPTLLGAPTFLSACSRVARARSHPPGRHECRRSAKNRDRCVGFLFKGLVFRPLPSAVGLRSSLARLDCSGLPGSSVA